MLPTKALTIKATVLTADGQRVTLDLVCPGRSAAEGVIDALYPDARYSSVIVVRRPKGGAA